MDNKEQKKECDFCKDYPNGDYGSCGKCNRLIAGSPNTIPTPPKALREEELNEKLVCLACKHEICPSCKLGCHNVDCEDSVSPIKICYDNLIGNQEKTTPRYSQNELDFLLKQDRERIKEKLNMLNVYYRPIHINPDYSKLDETADIREMYEKKNVDDILDEEQL